MAYLKDIRAKRRGFRHTPEEEFEIELRTSLRPRKAPEGFAGRTMRRRQLAALGGSDFRRSEFSRRRGPLRFAAAGAWLRWCTAACLLLTAAGGLVQHEYERRQAGERARQQVLLALRITGTALQDVRSKVEDPRSRAVYGSEQ